VKLAGLPPCTVKKVAHQAVGGYAKVRIFQPARGGKRRSDLLARFILSGSFLWVSQWERTSFLKADT
jgi:hypothetical protein